MGGIVVVDRPIAGEDAKVGVGQRCRKGQQAETQALQQGLPARPTPSPTTEQQHRKRQGCRARETEGEMHGQQAPESPKHASRKLHAGRASGPEEKETENAA